MNLPAANRTFYDVTKLAKLYGDLTRETVFNTARNYCLKPSFGGSFLNGINKESFLDNKSFRLIIGLFGNGEGTMPCAKLYYFKCGNQNYYKSKTSRYFNLVKHTMRDMDRRNTTSLYKPHESIWCFFPMYWATNNNLIYEEISAYILWFSKRPAPKVTLPNVFSIR